MPDQLPVRKSFRKDFTFDDPGSQKKNQPFLMDLVTLEKLFFQGLPKEIDYNVESGWQVVNAPGRNNPLYQYTGSEDIVTFTLTFYSDVQSRKDVLLKCKWLESLQKNDGYDNKPHKVMLAFGDIFRGATFIVYMARPKFSLFDREFGMAPKMAEVEMELRRVTEQNRKRTDILKFDT